MLGQISHLDVACPVAQIELFPAAPGRGFLAEKVVDGLVVDFEVGEFDVVLQTGKTSEGVALQPGGCAS